MQGVGLIPDRGTKIPRAMQRSQKQKNGFASKYFSLGSPAFAPTLHAFTHLSNISQALLLNQGQVLAAQKSILERERQMLVERKVAFNQNAGNLGR